MKKLLELNSLKDHVFDGMSIMVGGFMAVGTPEILIDENLLLPCIYSTDQLLPS